MEQVGATVPSCRHCGNPYRPPQWHGRLYLCGACGEPLHARRERRRPAYQTRWIYAALAAAAAIAGARVLRDHLPLSSTTEPPAAARTPPSLTLAHFREHLEEKARLLRSDLAHAPHNAAVRTELAWTYVYLGVLSRPNDPKGAQNWFNLARTSAQKLARLEWGDQLKEALAQADALNWRVDTPPTVIGPNASLRRIERPWRAVPIPYEPSRTEILAGTSTMSDWTGSTSPFAYPNRLRRGAGAARPPASLPVPRGTGLYPGGMPRPPANMPGGLVGNGPDGPSFGRGFAGGNGPGGNGGSIPGLGNGPGALFNGNGPGGNTPGGGGRLLLGGDPVVTGGSAAVPIIGARPDALMTGRIPMPLPALMAARAAARGDVRTVLDAGSALERMAGAPAIRREQRIELLRQERALYLTTAAHAPLGLDRADLYLVAANCSGELEDWAGQYQLLRRAADLAPYYPGVWPRLREAALRMGHYEESLVARRMAVEWSFPSIGAMPPSGGDGIR